MVWSDFRVCTEDGVLNYPTHRAWEYYLAAEPLAGSTSAVFGSGVSPTVDRCVADGAGNLYAWGDIFAARHSTNTVTMAAEMQAMPLWDSSRQELRAERVTANAITATTLELATGLGGAANIPLSGLLESFRGAAASSSPSSLALRLSDFYGTESAISWSLPALEDIPAQTVAVASVESGEWAAVGHTAAPEPGFQQHEGGRCRVRLPAGSMPLTFEFDANPVAQISEVGDLLLQGSITELSDARVKADLSPIPDALSKLQELRGYTYMRTDTGRRETGLVAQEVEKVLPEAVGAEGELRSIAYGRMVALLVEGLREVAERLGRLERRLA